MIYPDFFRHATGHAPYAYQCRLACGPAADPDRPETLEFGTDSFLKMVGSMASRLERLLERTHAAWSELGGCHPSLAQAATGDPDPSPVGGNPAECGGEHGVRAGAGGSGAPGDSPPPDRSTRFIETTRGILSYAQLAPLLAERVLRIEQDIVRGVFAVRALDQTLLLGFHSRLCSDLIPEWSGRWRTIEVRVGNLCPPPSGRVPMLIGDYAADLAARWPTLQTPGERLLETLAFAEGRLLTVHPFADFNGRVARLWLREILRRASLPVVDLTVEGETARRDYFAALEAADRFHWQPLARIWRRRFETAPMSA